jgi:hypothetical protein
MVDVAFIENFPQPPSPPQFDRVAKHRWPFVAEMPPGGNCREGRDKTWATRLESDRAKMTWTPARQGAGGAFPENKSAVQMPFEMRRKVCVNPINFLGFFVGSFIFHCIRS